MRLPALLLLALAAALPAQTPAPGMNFSDRGSPTLERHAAFVKALAATEPSRDRRLIKWSLEKLGTPYVLDCQGEGAGQDADPLFDPTRADCTVLVLQAAAAADAHSLPELLDGMRLANYRAWSKDGTVKFSDRFHYSEDRVRASPLFEDVTRAVFPAKDLVRESIVLNRKPDGSLTMPDVAWERPIELVYRPTATLTAADTARFPPVCGVMFVKRQNRKLGLLVGHEGIVLHGRVLVHASSAQKRVAMQPFVPYAKTRDGIVIYRFVPRDASQRRADTIASMIASPTSGAKR